MSLQDISDLLKTVKRLRAPDGCPWDREQTHQSLRPYLVEEAYEALEVLDQVDSPAVLKKDTVRYALREELGDVLMQVLIHSELASEENAFDFLEVARELNAKLIRRHPHVFGSESEKAASADAAFQKWEEQKAREKAAKGEPGKKGVLDGIPRGLPAIQKAARVIEKVSKVGFQWKNTAGPLDKVEEELQELKSEITAWEKLKAQGDTASAAEARARAEAELGDLLFCVCNLAFFLKIQPEDALRGTLAKFEKRFRFVEEKLAGTGKLPSQSTLEEMDQYWNEAKKSGL